MSHESPTETAPTCTADARKQKRRARWLIASLVLVPLAALVLFIWSLTLDEPPPDISDLTTPPPNHDPSTPGFYESIAALEPLYPTDLRNRLSKLGEMETYEKWDSQIADDIFHAVAVDFWTAFSESLKAPDTLTRWGAYSDQNPDTLQLIDLARLIRFSALRQLHAENYSGALQSAMQIIHFGHKLEKNSSTLVAFHGSLAVINDIGIQTLQTILRDSNLPKTLDMSPPIKQIQSLPPADDSLVVVLHGEFTAIHRFSANLAYHLPPSGALDKFLLSITYKHNQTFRLVAESIRDAKDVIKENYAASKPLADAVVSKWEKLCRRRSSFDVINQQGWIVIETISEGLLSGINRYYIIKSRLSAAQAALAARAYELDHGELPEILDALVPAYLPAVPIDYMDGQPIRYSKSERAIWTIGPNNLAAPLPPSPATRNDHTEDEKFIFRLDPVSLPSDEPPPAASQPDTPAP
jgi:hypothetical protein